MIHRDFQPARNEPLDDFEIQDIYCTRMFKLAWDSNDRRVLTGLNFQQEVKSGVNVAQCGYSQHIVDPETGDERAPGVKCSCGFYVYDRETWWMDNRNEDKVPRGNVRAVVKISGKTILGQRGLRVQEIEIVALAHNPEEFTDEELENLSEDFPNVKFYSSTKEMLRDFELTSLERPKGSQSLSPEQVKESLVGPSFRGFSLHIIAEVLVIGVALLFVWGLNLLEDAVADVELGDFYTAALSTGIVLLPVGLIWVCHLLKGSFEIRPGIIPALIHVIGAMVRLTLYSYMLLQGAFVGMRLLISDIDIEITDESIKVFSESSMNWFSLVPSMLSLFMTMAAVVVKFATIVTPFANAIAYATNGRAGVIYSRGPSSLSSVRGARSIPRVRTQNSEPTLRTLVRRNGKVIDLSKDDEEDSE